MMRLSEAIRLGSLMKARRFLPGNRGDRRACAVQMAALAVGREDLAYPTPAYYEIAELFGVDQEVLGNVWAMNDAFLWGALQNPRENFHYTIDEIADMVKRHEIAAGLWSKDELEAEVSQAEPALA